MANQEHLAKLREGVKSWNAWRVENTEVRPDLSEADLSFADLSYADLSYADLDKINLISADLSFADLNGAYLHEANLCNANFSEADLSFANISEADLHEANLSGANLSFASINEADLHEANLSFANIKEADLSFTDLSGANLSNARLTASSLLNSNLTAVTLNGACIEDWNVNSATNLDDVICEYVYLKRRMSVDDRRPSAPDTIFAPGEFTKLFQKALETVDLIFIDGIDWKVFFQSFQELRSQYGDENIAIQAIEKKSGDAFVIRLEVAPELDKAVIESQAKELYERDRQILEAQYRERLNAKDDQIEIYKKQSSSMEEIAKLLATRPIKFEEPKVTLKHEQILVLQAIQDGNQDSGTVAVGTNLSITLVNYYLQEMKKEGYVMYFPTQGEEGGCKLTDKGRIALTDPDWLLPHRQESSAHTHQTTINAPNSQFGFVNSGSGTVSDFTQNIGQNLNDINKLIDSLRETAQTFPAEQREEVLGHLDDLQEDLSKPEKQEPSRIKRRLKALVAIAIITAGTVDFTNNLTDLAEKLGVPIELNQSQTPPQLPSVDER